jgi:hypothetical protein
MTPPSQESSQQHVPPQEAAGAPWEQQQFFSVAGGRKALAALLGALSALGYSERARERVRQALGPALLSALRCSWAGGGAGGCTFRHSVREEYVLVEVEGVARDPAGPPLQGPHGAHLLQPAGEAAPFWARSYTWVRCDRRDDRLSVCTFHSAP